jgi:ketosteroid isomerase-like protein
LRWRRGADERRKEIDAFNAKFLEARLKMDTPGIPEAWSEDGVSLLPETAQLAGKSAIARFLAGVTEQLKGWRMEKTELDFQEIEVSADWALWVGLPTRNGAAGRRMASRSLTDAANGRCGTGEKSLEARGDGVDGVRTLLRRRRAKGRGTKG